MKRGETWHIARKRWCPSPCRVSHYNALFPGPQTNQYLGDPGGIPRACIPGGIPGGPLAGAAPGAMPGGGALRKLRLGLIRTGFRMARGAHNIENSNESLCTFLVPHFNTCRLFLRLEPGTKTRKAKALSTSDRINAAYEM